MEKPGKKTKLVGFGLAWNGKENAPDFIGEASFDDFLPQLKGLGAEMFAKLSAQAKEIASGYDIAMDLAFAEQASMRWTDDDSWSDESNWPEQKGKGDSDPCVVWLAGSFDSDVTMDDLKLFGEHMSESVPQSVIPSFRVKVADPNAEQYYEYHDGDYKNDGYVDWDDCKPY